MSNKRHTVITFPVALQHFVVQGVYAHAFVKASDYFGLVAVLLVTCAALFKQFTQVVFIELYIHISVLLCCEDNTFLRDIHKNSEYIILN